MPYSAAFPEPIINAAGVAIPKAQGHAIMITETKAKRLYVNPMFPTKYQPRPTPTAVKTMAGTKYFAT